MPAIGELVTENGFGEAMVGDCNGDCIGESLFALKSTINGGSKGVEVSAILSIGSSTSVLSGRMISIGVDVISSGSSLKRLVGCGAGVSGCSTKVPRVTEEARLDRG